MLVGAVLCVRVTLHRCARDHAPLGVTACRWDVTLRRWDVTLRSWDVTVRRWDVSLFRWDVGR